MADDTPTAGTVPVRQHQEMLDAHKATVEDLRSKVSSAADSRAQAEAERDEAAQRIADLEAQLAESQSRERQAAARVDQLEKRVNDLEQSGVGPGSVFVANRDMDVANGDGSHRHVLAGDELPDAGSWKNLRLWIENGYVRVKDREQPAAGRKARKDREQPAENVEAGAPVGNEAPPAARGDDTIEGSADPQTEADSTAGA